MACHHTVIGRRQEAGRGEFECSRPNRPPLPRYPRSTVARCSRAASSGWGWPVPPSPRSRVVRGSVTASPAASRRPIAYCCGPVSWVRRIPSSNSRSAKRSTFRASRLEARSLRVLITTGAARPGPRGSNRGAGIITDSPHPTDRIRISVARKRCLSARPTSSVWRYSPVRTSASAGSTPMHTLRRMATSIARCTSAIISMSTARAPIPRPSRRSRGGCCSLRMKSSPWPITGRVMRPIAAILTCAGCTSSIR